jgi:hypothetical protein
MNKSHEPQAYQGDPHGPIGGTIARSNRLVVVVMHTVRTPSGLGRRLDRGLGENLLGPIEVGLPDLHANAPDSAIQMPGLVGHVLIGDEALDAFGVKSSAQKLGRNQLIAVCERDELGGASRVGHGRTVACLAETALKDRGSCLVVRARTRSARGACWRLDRGQGSGYCRGHGMLPGDADRISGVSTH